MEGGLFESLDRSLGRIGLAQMLSMRAVCS